MSRLRVVTWNIHHGADAAGRLDLAAIAAVLRTLDADVVALQEVDRHWGSRSGGMDQARWLARQLGLRPTYAPNVRHRRLLRRDREYGIALLTRDRLADVRHELFPVGPQQEPRGYLVGRLATAAGPLTVCCTHLNADAGPGGEQAREEQLRLLLADLAAGSAAPTVLAGDFNGDDAESGPSLLASSGLVDAFAARGRGPGATLGDRSGGARIDRLWVRGAIRVHDAVVVDSDASDHRPLVATLVL